MPADHKPPKRIKDPELLKQLHLRWQECVLCQGTQYTEGRLSLHHIHKHPRDDLQANLVMLCGDGTRGCHGKIEAHDEESKRRLGSHIAMYRFDTMDYLAEKLGGDEAMTEWMYQNGYLRANS